MREYKKKKKTNRITNKTFVTKRSLLYLTSFALLPTLNSSLPSSPTYPYQHLARPPPPIANYEDERKPKQIWCIAIAISRTPLPVVNRKIPAARMPAKNNIWYIL